MSNDILEAQLRRRLPQTQEECLVITVKQSMAAHGLLTEPDVIDAACLGMVKGLFGEAYDSADQDQRDRWHQMAKEQYHRITRQLYILRQLRRISTGCGVLPFIQQAQHRYSIH